MSIWQLEIARSFHGLSDLFLYILFVFMYMIVNHNFITIESKNIIND